MGVLLARILLRFLVGEKPREVEADLEQLNHAVAGQAARDGDSSDELLGDDQEAVVRVAWKAWRVVPVFLEGPDQVRRSSSRAWKSDRHGLVRPASRSSTRACAWATKRSTAPRRWGGTVSKSQTIALRNSSSRSASDSWSSSSAVQIFALIPSFHMVNSGVAATRTVCPTCRRGVSRVAEHARPGHSASAPPAWARPTADSSRAACGS